MRGLFLFASLFSSIASVAADANSVRANLGALQNYTTQLGGNTLLYNGSSAGIAFALQVQSDAVQIWKVSKVATSDASASAAFSSADSSSVYSAANNVANVVKTALNNIITKANTFGELKPLVLPTIIQLKISTDNLINAIASKLTSTDKTNANNLKTQLDSLFNNAITTYGGQAR